ncbi:MAG: hypothetical protein KJ697_04345 [Nanoarchaeota archaeon]|nr:hypothetical protein [Nanoarchaeota archaeon]MBU4123922.1 hypothetical protein [Nanoarchaeota archaeon]
MINDKNLFFVLCVTLIVGCLIGMLMDNAVFFYPTNSFTEKRVSLAAVNEKGEGMAIPIVVEVKYGSGKVLTDIDKLLFWIDTQQSMQIARDVAVNITKFDLSDYDLVYTIETNETGIVGGPSAGAALAIATIAALSNRTIRTDVMMTGTINEDGTIGPVGGILEKAKAARDIGAKIFIVPIGQGTELKLVPKESCIKTFGFLYCETKYQEETIDIAKNSGIAIIEVKYIEDAAKYFFE